MLAPLADRPPGGLILNDLNGVAFWVFDVEVRIADAAFAHRGGNLNALRPEIDSHRFGVVCFDGNVIQAVGVRRLFGEQFNVLPLIDLEKRQ